MSLPAFRLLQRALQLMLAVVLASPAHAELRILITSVETPEPGASVPRGVGPAQMRRSEMTLVIGDSYFDVDDGTARMRYDFAARRIRTIDRSKLVKTDNSLYGDVAFRAAELNNRIALGKGFAAAKVADNPLVPVLIEQELSLLVPGGAAPERTAAAGRTTFAAGRQTLAVISAGGSRIGAAEMKGFVRYLRYRGGLHPDIVAFIGSAGMVPNELEIAHYFGGRLASRIRLTLVRTETIAVSAVPAWPDGMPLAEIAISPLVAKADALGAAGFGAALAGLRSRAIAAAKSGRNLEALCLFLDCVLSVGSPPPEMAGYRDAINQDPDAAALLAAIRPASRDAAESAIETLDALAAKAGEGKRTIKTWKANILTSLGKPQEAIALFKEVVAENPACVGAWHDLGQLFYNSFDAQSAWQSWDLARRLAPSHPQLNDIKTLETKLTTDHPELF